MSEAGTEKLRVALRHALNAIQIFDENRLHDPMKRSAYREGREILQDSASLSEACPCNGGCHNGHTIACSDSCRGKDVQHVI